MSYQYSLNFEAASVAAATTLIAIRPGAAFGLKLLRVWATQNGSATSAQNRILIGFQDSGGGAPSGLTAFTPRKLDSKDVASLYTGGTAAAAGTCGVLTTTLGAGTLTTRINEAFNSLTGFLWTPAFEEIRLRPGSTDILVVRAPEAWAPNGGWEGGLIFGED